MIFTIDNYTDSKHTDVYENIDDLTRMVEWQDLLDQGITIIDEEGNIYSWDHSKSDEFATLYNYTMKKSGLNEDLGHNCFRVYNQLNKPYEFDLIGS